MANPIAGGTVLHAAVRFRRTDDAKKICQEHVELLKVVNEKYETPLHYAAHTGNTELVRYFIERARREGDNYLRELLVKQNTNGETALYQAVHQQHRDVMVEFMRVDSHLASIPASDNCIPPLYLATMLHSIPILTSLLQELPPASQVPREAYIGPDGQTALHGATLSKNTRFVKMILWSKPELANAIDTSGNTALHCAAKVNNYTVAKILLEREKNLAYIADNSGLYPVHIAAQKGHLEVVIELFKQCPDSDVLLDRNGRNFLHLAVKEKRVNVVRWVNERVIPSETEENVRKFGMAMNARDDQWNTPLHLAVEAGDPCTVFHLLLSKRVDLDRLNKDMQTPLDIARAKMKTGFSDVQNPDYVIYSTLQTIGCSHVKYTSTAIGESEQQLNEEMEKEVMGSCESMAKSLSIGSVLIASAAFAAAFTVSGVYNNSKDLYDNNQSKLLFEVFFVLNAYAFLCAIISTGLVVEAALTFLHVKYRKRYLLHCASLIMMAAKCFIIAFTTAAYLVLAPLRKWLAILIYCMGAIAPILMQPRLWPNLLVSRTVIKYRGCMALFSGVIPQWIRLIIGNLFYLCVMLFVLLSSLSTVKVCHAHYRRCQITIWVLVITFLLVISWDLLRSILRQRNHKQNNLVRTSMV